MTKDDLQIFKFNWIFKLRINSDQDYFRALEL